MWRDRNRGLSFENSRDCDAIFRQFFHVDLAKSIPQVETADVQLQASDVSVNMVDPEQHEFEGAD